MNEIKCICGESSELRRLSSLTVPGFGKKSLWECSACGLIQFFPRPFDDKSATSFYQQPDYMPRIQEKEYFGYFKAIETHLLSKINLNFNVKILDFGAGYCWYQKFFLSEGYQEVHSLEINEYLAGFGRDQLKLNNIHTSSKTIPQSHFDVVISNQVFEHLSNPLKTLNEEILPFLKPGGCICISVPNWNSWNRPILRKRWLGYSPEDHIWFFTKRAIKKVFSNNSRLELLDISVYAAAGRRYDGFVPRNLIKKLYYFTFWIFFERIRRGEQLIFILRKKA